MLSNAHKKNDPNEPIPEWISIWTMLSQNAVHPDAKGTMTLQKLVDAARKRKSGRKLKCPLKYPQRKKKKTKKKKN